ncbi:hypothetical protein ACFOGG_08100 [Brenneria rubrifaciens]
MNNTCHYPPKQRQAFSNRGFSLGTLTRPSSGQLWRIIFVLP